MKTAGQKEGAGLLERVAPGPYVRGAKGQIEGTEDGVTVPLGEIHNADQAQLYCLAYDHALLLTALVAGKAEIAPCVDIPGSRFITVDDYGWRCESPLALDAAGCPALTDELRAALRKVVGSNG